MIEQERSAVKKVINLNPLTLSVKRRGTTTNARGVSYEDTSTTTTVNFTNPVRIHLMNKRAEKIVNNETIYYTIKAYFILTDYETVIQKNDRFTWNSKNYKILDVVPITFQGAITKYQAEIQEITSV